MIHEKAIMFDLDGTITNTLSLSISGSRNVLKNVAKINMSDEDIKSKFGKTEDALFKYYCADNWAKCVRAYADFFEKHAGPDILFGGMLDVLKYLKSKKVRMSVITGRGPLSAEVILRRTEIIDYFDYVKTGSELGSIKAECMTYVLGKWKQDPQKTFYIGDVVQDILDAKKAGLTALSAAWSEHTDKKNIEHEKPFMLFNKVSDFFDFARAEFK
ncbi:MAG: HAD family hydrolase [Elusimicrobiota bacterium]|jgi:HAD superfamily hydrolase (TIGR01549 family)|nr:HAD family hydrolase [Elusimicrobiota bacterium]